MFEVVANELEGKYISTIYSCSYESPIYHLAEIEEQLKDKCIKSGYILFDTLLSKGDVSNRFIECYYENNTFIKQTLKSVMVAKGDDIRKNSSSFYKNSGIDLNHSMLTTIQKKIIISGHTL